MSTTSTTTHSTTTLHRADRRHGATNIAAALLELANQLVVVGDEASACRRLADGLKEICDLDTVAVALAGTGGTGRIRAISSLVNFDPQASGVRTLQQAATACLSGIEPAESSTGDGTHERPWCVPLRSPSGKALAACAIVFVPATDTAGRRSIVQTSVDVIAPIFEAGLDVARRRSAGALRRAVGRIVVGRRSWLVAGLLVAAMFVPLPLPVRCECRVEPQVRRSVAAPYNAVWRKSHVRPGDVVKVGQSLGLLDDSELQRELAAATAERDRAAKSGDVNAAAGKTAAAQIDRLEVRRIEQRRELLLSRLSGIEVKSPIAGVVLSGEWERAEGAPLKQGTILFEIAPLDRVVVEAFVPEKELDRLAPGSTVSVVLDARSGESRAATIERIHPRAAIRDAENVFTAEPTLDNTDGSLRPGMQGRVDVAVPPRSLGSIVVEEFRWFTERLRF
jgi:multidrug efflux pump subunit AcrA (membrane-fusion protein)